MIRYLENENDFEAEVSNGNVIVDFYADWCGPCKMMARTIEDIEEDYPDVTFLKINTDKFPSVAQSFGIFSIPTFLAYQNGQRITFQNLTEEENELVGGRDEDQFRFLLDNTFARF